MVSAMLEQPQVRSWLLWTCLPLSKIVWLVVSTPSEKYKSNWESSPNRGENKEIFETTTSESLPLKAMVAGETNLVTPSFLGSNL